MTESSPSDSIGPNQGVDIISAEIVEELAPAELSELQNHSNRKSLWGKAKEALNDVSTRTSSVSNAVASKAVALGKSSATKTTEIGKQAITTVGDATRGTLEASKNVYTGSKLASAVDYIDGELDQRGAKKALKDTTEAVVGKLDQITGKRLVELLEERLKVQDQYNDILATRLAEALARIAQLEASVNELTTRASSSPPSSIPG